MFKKQNGITLVALIITIIVMLILAGVSISLVLGENGVMTQAQNAEDANVKGALIDAISMANADIMAAHYADTAAADPKDASKIGDYITANFKSYEGKYTVSIETVGTDKVVRATQVGGSKTIDVPVTIAADSTRGYQTIKVK